MDSRKFAPQTKRFYYKSFINPTERYQKITGLERDKLVAIQMMYLGYGLSRPDIRKILYLFGYRIHRDKLRLFLIATRKWQITQAKRLKSTQCMNRKWLEDILKRDNSSAFLDKLIN